MDYEIDFIGVRSDQVLKDSDAICFRFKDDSGKDRVFIYDCGYSGLATEMCSIMEQYYFTTNIPRIIDGIFVSHPDQDHTSGIPDLIDWAVSNDIKIEHIYMNRPWLYIKELWPYINDGRITPNSFCNRLKQKYKYIAEIETMAKEHDISIVPTFQGMRIRDKLLILSPSKDFYLDLIVQSKKTDDMLENSKLNESTREGENEGSESWENETLTEDVVTSAENESSLIIKSNSDQGQNFLLTGDAGIIALGNAINYTDKMGIDLSKDVSFVQIPHHGGRHNVSPSILNELIGPIVSKGKSIGKVAYVSVAVKSDHPRHAVVNAFIRRGVSVYKTAGSVIHHKHGIFSNRKGWSGISPLKFY